MSGTQLVTTDNLASKAGEIFLILRISAQFSLVCLCVVLW